MSESLSELFPRKAQMDTDSLLCEYGAAGKLTDQLIENWSV